jgi:hypothetical protein
LGRKSQGLKPRFGKVLLPGLKPRPISGATAKAKEQADPCGMTARKASATAKQKQIPKGNDRKKGKSNSKTAAYSKQIPAG